MAPGTHFFRIIGLLQDELRNFCYKTNCVTSAPISIFINFFSRPSYKTDEFPKF